MAFAPMPLVKSSHKEAAKGNTAETNEPARAFPDLPVAGRSLTIGATPTPTRYRRTLSDVGALRGHLIRRGPRRVSVLSAYGQAAECGYLHKIEHDREHGGPRERAEHHNDGQWGHRNAYHGQAGGNQNICTRGHHDPHAGPGCPQLPTFAIIVRGCLISENYHDKCERSERIQIQMRSVFPIRQD